MTYHCLDNLEPAAFFRWFGEIAAIPHGSRKEQQITAWLQKFAADRGIPCELDRAGNLLMELRAHAGYEDQPAILFQAHMDMIWKADEGVDFDFATQPLDLYVEGDCIRARGTTLGADNAVGLATMLALADDPTIPRPALQLLFTVAEEVGMVGIRAVDPATITARRMINMDCGDSHVLCVSSAGKNDLGIDHTFPTEAPCGQGLRITLSGGKGGHPSICANAGRFCAAGAFGDLLSALPAFRLCSLTGSEAIMGWGEAVILAPEGSEASLQRQFDAIASIYAQTDEGIRMELTPCQPCSALSEADSRKIAQVLLHLRSAQYRCDGNRPDTIVTSGAVTAMSLENGSFSLRFRLRSTVTADSNLQYARFRSIIAPLGLELKSLDSYEGWSERFQSPFRDKFQRVHQAIFGRPMDIERAPGGVETGILTHKLTDMDALGVAPTGRGAHSTQERLYISETADYWQLLLAVLAEKE